MKGYIMNEEWKKLYDIAFGKINPHEISENMYVGGVAAAVLIVSNDVRNFSSRQRSGSFRLLEAAGQTMKIY